MRIILIVVMLGSDTLSITHSLPLEIVSAVIVMGEQTKNSKLKKLLVTCHPTSDKIEFLFDFLLIIMMSEAVTLQGQWMFVKSWSSTHESKDSQFGCCQLEFGGWSGCKVILSE